MLKLLSRLFQPHQATTKVVPLAVRGKYDAAQTTEDNRRHWAMADGLSAAAANSRSVRRTIRNRARYEVANNSYAKGIIATLANDVVGRGPILQVAAGAAEANTRIERAFSNWAIEIGLAQKLRTMRQSKAIDGEAFAMLVTNEALRSPIKLDLKLIEAEQVTDPDDRQNHADGIRFDQFGNPASYTVLREHPGSGTTSTEKLSPVPAENMIHWFGVDRPGQVRGIPDITPALPLFAQLRRFTLAVLAAAETAASFAAVLYTTAPANGEADDVDPFLPIEIEQRMMTTVPAGWQMGQLRPEQPCSTYAEFKRELINEIARCLNMPFNVAACNSASYNYASGRLDHQVYF
ncbi:MAG: phage portal protein, partial [Planctomycetota bacterium]